MIILTADEAAKVRGQSPTRSWAALEPVLLKDGTFMLPEDVQDDLAHFDAHVLLATFPRATPSADLIYATTPAAPTWESVGTRQTISLTPHYSAEAQQFFDRLPVQPSAFRKAKYERLITWLVATGIYAKADCFYVFKEGDVEAAKLNLISSSFSLTIVGGVSFAPHYGFIGFANSYLNTGFNPRTAATPKFTQDSASFFIWDSFPDRDAGVFGSVSGAVPNLLYPRFTDDRMYLNVNASSDDSVGVAVATGAGLSGGSRLSSSGYTYYRDGEPIATRTNTSALPASSNLAIGKFSNSSIGEWAAVFIGGGLTDAEVAILYQALRDFVSDSFASDGSTYPMYGATALPSAAYAAGKTWIVWEGWNGSARKARVRTYDHVRHQWSAAYDVGTSPLVDDDHGVPTICRDPDGYWHVFYGAHSMPVKHSVTAAPDDPTTWAARPNIGAPAANLTYPRPVLVGSTVYLFTRGDLVNAGDQSRYLTVFPMSFVAGVEMIGAGKHIGDFGSAARFYAGTAILKPNTADIHIVAALSPDSQPSTPRNVYYFIYRTSDGSLRSIDGRTVITAASLPADLASMNASFRIYEAAVDEVGGLPSHCFDDAGEPHVIISTGSGTAFGNYHLTYHGGAWSPPQLLGTSIRSSDVCAAPASDGGIDAYWFQGPATYAQTGGDMWTAHRAPDGTWGASRLMRPAHGKALSAATLVTNGQPEFCIAFFEVFQQSLDDLAGIGTLIGYAYGDDGFLRALPG